MSATSQGYRTIDATATANGWSIHRPDSGTFVTTWRRRNRGRTEYLRIEIDTLGRPFYGCWAPQLDGLHARQTRAGVVAWAIMRLTAPVVTAAQAKALARLKRDGIIYPYNDISLSTVEALEKRGLAVVEHQGATHSHGTLGGMDGARGRWTRQWVCHPAGHQPAQR